jgi:hypothetical protein
LTLKVEGQDKNALDLELSMPKVEDWDLYSLNLQLLASKVEDRKQYGLSLHRSVLKVEAWKFLGLQFFRQGQSSAFNLSSISVQKSKLQCGSRITPLFNVTKYSTSHIWVSICDARMEAQEKFNNFTMDGLSAKLKI